MLPDQKWLTNCVCVCVYVCEDSGEIPCVLRKVSNKAPLYHPHSHPPSGWLYGHLRDLWPQAHLRVRGRNLDEPTGTDDPYV